MAGIPKANLEHILRLVWDPSRNRRIPVDLEQDAVEDFLSKPDVKYFLKNRLAEVKGKYFRLTDKGVAEAKAYFSSDVRKARREYLDLTGSLERHFRMGLRPWAADPAQEVSWKHFLVAAQNILAKVDRVFFKAEMDEDPRSLKDFRELRKRIDKAIYTLFTRAPQMDEIALQKVADNLLNLCTDLGNLYYTYGFFPRRTGTMTLRAKVIRLAKENPLLRKELLSLVRSRIGRMNTVAIGPAPIQGKSWPPPPEDSTDVDAWLGFLSIHMPVTTMKEKLYQQISQTSAWSNAMSSILRAMKEGTPIRGRGKIKDIPVWWIKAMVAKGVPKKVATEIVAPLWKEWWPKEKQYAKRGYKIDLTEDTVIPIKPFKFWMNSDAGGVMTWLGDYSHWGGGILEDILKQAPGNARYIKSRLRAQVAWGAEYAGFSSGAAKQIASVVAAGF